MRNIITFIVGPIVSGICGCLMTDIKSLIAGFVLCLMGVVLTYVNLKES